MSDTPTISTRVRRQILAALRKGIAPNVGLEHIAVGRVFEIEALGLSLDEVADCGVTFRMLVGDYGTGKTFLLHLTQLAAQHRGFVTTEGSLAHKHRLLIGSNGRGRGLIGEFVRNLATARYHDGGALELILERFLFPEDGGEILSGEALQARLEPLTELEAGRDFSAMVTTYAAARQAGDERVQKAAIRWLTADYRLQRDAREDGLEVSRVLGDEDVVRSLRLLAAFTKLAGFQGLIVCLDEAEGVMPANQKVRHANLSELVELHDAVDGPGLGIFVASTVRFVEDVHRGCFSHERLRDRVEKHLTGVQRPNKHAPILALQPLLPPDTLQLIRKIRDVYGAHDPTRYRVPDEALQPHIHHLLQERGHHWLENTREVVQHFTRMLDELDTNPDLTWQEALGHDTFSGPADEPDDTLTMVGGNRERP